MKQFWKTKSTPNNQREITQEVITSAYNSRKKEIESLKQYDRGEKIITPSKLSDLVRSI